jgi:hypothetical protein
MIKQTFAFALLLFAFGCLVGHGLGCGVQPPTLKQAGAVADAACTVVDAFAASPEEQAICATADDILGLMADVRAQRADAGPEQKAGRLGRASGKCKIVGTVCATDEELAPAIARRKASR